MKSPILGQPTTVGVSPIPNYMFVCADCGKEINENVKTRKEFQAEKDNDDGETTAVEEKA